MGGPHYIVLLNVRGANELKVTITTKETSGHYAFLMKDHATIYEILERKTDPVADEAFSTLYRKHGENILSNTTGIQAA